MLIQLKVEVLGARRLQPPTTLPSLSADGNARGTSFLQEDAAISRRFSGCQLSTWKACLSFFSLFLPRRRFFFFKPSFSRITSCCCSNTPRRFRSGLFIPSIFVGNSRAWHDKSFRSSFFAVVKRPFVSLVSLIRTYPGHRQSSLSTTRLIARHAFLLFACTSFFFVSFLLVRGSILVSLLHRGLKILHRIHVFAGF